MDGLCFNYPENFSREHVKQCSMKGIYFFKLDEADGSDSGALEDMTMSACALMRIRTGSTFSSPW
jgi:hypothetical protein